MFKGAAGRLSVDFLSPRAVMMGRLPPTARVLPGKRGNMTLGDGVFRGRPSKSLAGIREAELSKFWNP